MPSPIVAKQLKTNVRVEKHTQRGYFVTDKGIPPEVYRGGFVNLKQRAGPFREGQIIEVDLRYNDDSVFVMRARALSEDQPQDQNGDEADPNTPQAGFYGDYWFPATSIAFLSTVDVIAHKTNQAVLVVLKGGSGYGKSSAAKAIADESGRKFLRINSPDVRDPEEWFGIRNATDGTTGFELSQLSKAWQEGNHVILIDEINRVEPVITNALLPLFDFSGGLELHGETIYGGANTIVFMTMNEGFKFTGTYQGDVALLNRSIGTLIVAPPPAKVEVEILTRKIGIEEGMAKRIVDAMTDLRRQNDDGFDASTRAALNVATLIHNGLKPRLAFEVGIISNALNPKNVTDLINSKFGLL